MSARYFFRFFVGCWLLFVAPGAALAQSADKMKYNTAVAAAPSAKNPSEARARAMLDYIRAAQTRDERIDRSYEVVKQMLDIDFAATGFALYNIARCTELDVKMREGLSKDQQEALARFRTWYQNDDYSTSSPTYPAGLPRAGIPWGGAAPVVAAPAKDPAREQADCDRFVQQATLYDAQFKVGDVIYPRGHSGEFYLYDFDCATRTFLAVGPDNTVRNPVTSDWVRLHKGPYVMCPVCHGHFVSSSRKVVADDDWHTSNTNAAVQVRKVNGTKTTNVVEYCKRCDGKGYVRKGM